jgi:hypothetical protein
MDIFDLEEETRDLVVVRLNAKQYAIEGIEDEPLTQAQLIVLLAKALQVKVEEIGMMFTEFNLNKDAKKAYFGILNMQFLYVR